jgi:hypothetical protein
MLVSLLSLPSPESERATDHLTRQPSHMLARQSVLHFPALSDEAETLRAILIDHVESIRPLQAADGRWHQVFVLGAVVVPEGGGGGGGVCYTAALQPFDFPFVCVCVCARVCVCVFPSLLSFSLVL